MTILLLAVLVSISSACSHVGRLESCSPGMSFNSLSIGNISLHRAGDEVEIRGETKANVSHLSVVVNGRLCVRKAVLPSSNWKLSINDMNCIKNQRFSETPFNISCYGHFHDELRLLDGSPLRTTNVINGQNNANYPSVLIQTLHQVEESGFRAGIMYEGWHAPVCQALLAAGAGTTPLSVEKLLRSMGSQNLTLEDQAQQYDTASAFQFFYHSIPEQGPHCIYRKRVNETQGYVPDCVNITETLTMHNNLLVAAGIDYAVLDATNLPSPGPMTPPLCTGGECQGDLLQLRPAEVVFEEFYLLRQSGINTPQIAVWQTVAGSNPTEWWYIIDRIYNNASYQDLVLTDAATGKKVFFIPSLPEDSSLISTIESYGIIVVLVWANLDSAQFEQGEWVFMSPCTAGSGGSSTNVAGVPCNQQMTTNSPIGAHGTAITVGPSYQLMYSSLPFQAAGKLGGLTLQNQFVRAIGTVPDYLWVGTFNEAIAQPQPNPYASVAAAGSMGLNNYDPASHNDLWVDMYGAEISRDLQPTQEYGTLYWDLFASCMRVYALSQGGLVTNCSVANEPCCTTNTSAAYNNVWSLTRSNPSDNLVTNSQNEFNILLGDGWSQICNAVTGPTLFCNTAASETAFGQGPFLVFSNPASSQDPPRLTVYRCYSNQVHFISQSPSCYGLGHMEFLLGYTQSTPSSDVPRSLRLCQFGGQNLYHHQLDGPCPQGDTEIDVLGYVH